MRNKCLHYSKEYTMALSSAQVGDYGEKHVAAWLRTNNYTVNQNTKLPGSTDIEAVGTTKSLLVQVKPAVWPSVPSALGSDEVRNIKARATKKGWEPWQALVIIDTAGNLVGAVRWTKF